MNTALTVAIAALILQLIEFVWMAFIDSKHKLQVNARSLAIVTGGSLTFGVAGFVAYWAPVIIGTILLPPGEPAAVCERTTGFAAFVGMMCGLVWGGFLLPLLKRAARGETGGGEGDGSE